MSSAAAAATPLKRGRKQASQRHHGEDDMEEDGDGWEPTARVNGGDAASSSGDSDEGDEGAGAAAADEEQSLPSTAKKAKRVHDPSLVGIAEGSFRKVLRDLSGKHGKPVTKKGRQTKESMAELIHSMDPDALTRLKATIDPFLKPIVEVIIGGEDADLQNVTFSGKKLLIRRQIGTFSCDIVHSYFAFGNTIGNLIIKVCGAGVEIDRLALLDWINMERMAERGTSQARALGEGPYVIHADDTYSSASLPDTKHPKVDAALLAKIRPQLMPDLNFGFEPSRS